MESTLGSQLHLQSRPPKSILDIHDNVNIARHPFALKITIRFLRYFSKPCFLKPLHE